jgi:hypothetical protein
MASTLVANPNLEAALWLWQVAFFLAPTFGVPSTWIGGAVSGGEVRVVFFIICIISRVLFVSLS